jgi:type I protein arginine methyltransferase
VVVAICRCADTVCGAGVGDYDCIRLVNFVRRQVADSAPIDTILAAVNDNSSPLWEDDALLVPVLENDPLLYCLGEAVEVEDDDTGCAGEEESKVSGSPLEVVGHAMRPPA